MNAAGGRPGRRGWGWWLWAAVSVLLLLNGITLLFVGSSPSVFRSDTGVALEELRQAFPTVAVEMARRGRILALMLVLVGGVAAVATFAGLARGERSARAVLGWIAVALAALGVYFVALGRVDIAALYLIAGVLGALGLLRPTRREA